ncbi:bifunctional cobalt-precorrin-7 (C(5))-methyltransferase/cobalt-precorrin-6B (C(15))-methyltransferase [Austwickia chelonae]|uniref:Precorrin-6Y C5,15-methyltransferase n=1 Tax=Austwickia chelonae NBRC 105200 TaxID=1184607 RepID=K6UM86_9MICO|nr:bifunctional cobalt-precorrin-7 (C(5))-methyltransferase/cobalt-precorrin-6B (C(15))-methyltransferase [Austwickia chelonae]GAB77896.1 precorrin-6Y C5,15-methyltransferase [Austwickia chelonae NBRC 105200]
MIDVVGVGAGGLPSEGSPERVLIDGAEVVLGGPRHLELLPEGHRAVRCPWPSPLRAGLPDLLRDVEGRRVVVLASGDPLVSGVGSTLVDLLGAGSVRIHPGVSSAALARARQGWSAESCEVVTVVGRDLGRLRRDLAPGARLVVLLSGPDDVARIARIAVEEGYGPSRLTVWGRLGGPDESRVEGDADRWAFCPPEGLPALCLLTVEARPAPGAPVRSVVPGLPDDAFENDGQLTKRHIRATALAHLAPTPGALLWDLGAGAGSVGIEWARVHPRNRVVSVERHPDRFARILRNVDRLGVGGQVTVVHAAVADVLLGARSAPELAAQAPDAVFIGGGAREEIVEAAYAAVRPGGRVVVHGVTAETEALAVSSYRRWGGDLARIAVETAEPIGSYIGWSPSRTVVQWSTVKPVPSGSAGPSCEENA